MSESQVLEKSESALAVQKATAEEIREVVRADKETGLEVIKAAEQELSSFSLIVPHQDITGKPHGVIQFERYKMDQLRNLQVVTRTPYFLRVTADRTERDKTERVLVLLTKARNVGAAVFGEAWMLTTWTSPIGLAIRGKAPGERVKFERDRVVIFDVREFANYEELLPRFVNGEFVLPDGRPAAVVSEDELEALLATAPTTAELPSVEYETKRTFGLNDIIVLVDKPQIAALALPFKQSAIIEGPPGTGKTSIGIMRIAVLYDQQWEELGLQRDRDRPFHDYNTMRVLVYNDEMVEYLKSLASSIGVEHVQVGTTKDFFRRICRETKVLSGTERRDRPSLAIIKGRREALVAYFAGFKMHSKRWWQKHEGELRRELFNLGPDFLTLADRLDGWIQRIQDATVEHDRINGSVGIADGLSDVVGDIRRGRSPTRAATSPAKRGDATSGDGKPAQLDPNVNQGRLADARKLVEGAIRGACSRAEITRAMFELPEYDAIKNALRQNGVPLRRIEDGDRLWRKQYEGDFPAYGELDLAMSAWLGANLLLSVKDTGRPWIGGRLERLTHIVVDEAQDLSASHIAVLASQLVPNGTMTLLGDIHQSLNPYAGLRRWDEARLQDAVMSTFGVNHRQTRQLGEFLQALHPKLVQEECHWEPSSKAFGPVPRAGKAQSWADLIPAIEAEIRHWRGGISGETGATVAVLYDGRLDPKRLQSLQSGLENALSDDLIPVELALPHGGGEALRRTDRVIIASVRQTKGLEFDAVIFVEPRAMWSKPLEDIDIRARNGLYVATSRARAGLSMCMNNLPACIESLVRDGLCQMVHWGEDVEKGM